jgi:hypothetical protein
MRCSSTLIPRTISSPSPRTHLSDAHLILSCRSSVNRLTPAASSRLYVLAFNPQHRFSHPTHEYYSPRPSNPSRLQHDVTGPYHRQVVSSVYLPSTMGIKRRPNSSQQSTGTNSPSPMPTSRRTPGQTCTTSSPQTNLQNSSVGQAV